MRFWTICLSIFLCHTASASPIDETIQGQNVPELDSSVDHLLSANNVRDGKQFFFSRTTTVTVTAGTVTSTLTTYRSCYKSDPAGISTCVSQVLTGRKKRDESKISEEAINAYNEQGEPIDLSHLIAASKVSEKASDYDETLVEESIGEIRLNPVVEIGTSREGRFVTYVTTVTASVTSTVTATTTPLQVSSLFFTSAVPGQCFPLGLMLAAGVQPC